MKNTKLLLPILIFLICACANKTQDDKKGDFEKYDKYVWSAMLQYKDKDYTKSLENFQKAIEVIPDENVSDYFYAAAAAFHLDKPELAKKLIIESIVQTKTWKEYFLGFGEFYPYREHKLFGEIEKNYDKYIAEFYDNLEHPEIYREVDSLLEVDQKYRQPPIDWDEMAKHDSLNINRFMEITKKYGWYDKGWLLLWHHRGSHSPFGNGESNYIWDFFKPYIDEQIEKGNIRKDIWARYEDEKSVVHNKEQIYGFYSSQFDEYPVIDVENLDKRRAKYNLPPFWYLNEVYNTSLPKGYTRTVADSIYGTLRLN